MFVDIIVTLYTLLHILHRGRYRHIAMQKCHELHEFQL